MESFLRWIIDWDLVLVIHLVHRRLRATVLLTDKLIEGTHSHLVSEDINVALHQGNWLRQNIETCADQVHKQHLVVLYDAEYTLIIVPCALGAEVDNDSCGGVGFNSTHILRKAEHIVAVSVELERGGEVAVIDNV